MILSNLGKSPEEFRSWTASLPLALNASCNHGVSFPSGHWSNDNMAVRTELRHVRYALADSGSCGSFRWWRSLVLRHWLSISMGSWAAGRLWSPNKSNSSGSCALSRTIGVWGSTPWTGGTGGWFIQSSWIYSWWRSILYSSLPNCSSIPWSLNSIWPSAVAFLSSLLATLVEDSNWALKIWFSLKEASNWFRRCWISAKALTRVASAEACAVVVSILALATAWAASTLTSVAACIAASLACATAWVASTLSSELATAAAIWPTTAGSGLWTCCSKWIDLWSTFTDLWSWNDCEFKLGLPIWVSMGSTVGISDMSTNGGGLDVPLGEFCIISNCSCSLLLYALGGLWGYGELESLGLYLLESLDTPLLELPRNHWSNWSLC